MCNQFSRIIALPQLKVGGRDEYLCHQRCFFLASSFPSSGSSDPGSCENGGTEETVTHPDSGANEIICRCVEGFRGENCQITRSKKLSFELDP